jgi:hypothetical protein
MGRADLRKSENKAGTKDADKKAPYVFSLDVKLRKPEDAKDETADSAVAGTDLSSGGAPAPAKDAAGDAKAPPPPANLAAATDKAASAVAGAAANAVPAPAAKDKDAQPGEKK